MKRGDRMRPVWCRGEHTSPDPAIPEPTANEAVSAVSRGEPRRPATLVRDMLAEDVAAYIAAGRSPLTLLPGEADQVVALVAADRITDHGPGGVVLTRREFHAYVLTVRCRALDTAVRAARMAADQDNGAMFTTAVDAAAVISADCAAALATERAARHAYDMRADLTRCEEYEPVRRVRIAEALDELRSARTIIENVRHELAVARDQVFR